MPIYKCALLYGQGEECSITQTLHLETASYADAATQLITEYFPLFRQCLSARLTIQSLGISDVSVIGDIYRLVFDPSLYPGLVDGDNLPVRNCVLLRLFGNDVVGTRTPSNLVRLHGIYEGDTEGNRLLSLATFNTWAAWFNGPGSPYRVAVTRLGARVYEACPRGTLNLDLSQIGVGRPFAYRYQRAHRRNRAG